MKTLFISMRIFVLGLLLLAGAASVWFALRSAFPSRSSEARLIDMSVLVPGTEKTIEVGGHTVHLSIPAGEGLSFGTVGIEVPDVGFGATGIERDGCMETVWIADVNGDGVEDGVFVVRCAGSSSYASLFVLESTGATFRLQNVPSISGVPGYMGHDEVSVRANVIWSAFPTYIDGKGPRVDRQWEPGDALSGRLPVASGPDSNAAPSGVTKKLRFDYATSRWE